jgi:hypothetical protein
MVFKADISESCALKASELITPVILEESFGPKAEQVKARIGLLPTKPWAQ